MNSSKLFGRKALFMAVSVLALGASGAAFGGTDTSDLSVSANVVASCDISTSAVSFGDYDPIVANVSTPLDQTGSVSITCTVDSAPVITLGEGANPEGGSSASAPLRQMADGENLLSYQLYSDSAGGTVWGNTEGTGVSDTGTGEEEVHTVYGRVAAGQNTVPVGNYADTVVATVTF